MSRNKNSQDVGPVAIVGMAGRFPGAPDVGRFWQNLRNGVESISSIDDEEWAKALKVHPAFLVDPNLVRMRPKLEGVDLFDASFFGFTPRAAQILDPQQRLFLECAWEALENAGYDSERFPGRVGVYAGVTPSTYLLNLLQFSSVVGKVGWLDADLSNRCDSLATRVAYKLNLNGPSFTVQAYCSTSLVAIHLASQSLRHGECDMALAGGVTITVPQETGYLYMEGGILSSDGHTRTFDAKANGMVFGNGVGIVVLKRLADAIAAGDQIWAVLRGSATNNDGSLKAGFTAPGVTGQTEVIVSALEAAGVDPETIGYVEAHGTATLLGDPVEVSALTKAYRRWTDKRGYCAIGSAKTNVGHLDAAAGVTGVVKVALALAHQEIPPSLNFDTPNPQIDFESSPFFVNTALTPWASTGAPRRAGVSAYGIGGANAHAILEEAPLATPSDPPQPWQVIPLSARTSNALDAATERLRAHLLAHPEDNLADVAYTLQVGRRGFDHRRVIVGRDRDDALAALAEATRQQTARADRRNPSLAFMFTGQGSQYVNMGRGLYETEPVFRSAIDDCAERLVAHLGFDLREVLYPSGGETEDVRERLKQTSVTQPALFVVEYALARLWKSWGVVPTVMIGHSIGEYVAAHLADVFTLDNALALVAERGRLMQSMPGGSMLAVQLPAAEVEGLLTDRICLAAVNTPNACVLGGPTDDIARLEAALQERGAVCRRLQTSHAFHSSSMDPVLEAFARCAERATPRKPTLPFVSNLTGTWITDEQAVQPAYWAEHLRSAVQFSPGVRQVIERGATVLLEVGPGTTLSGLARQHVDPSRSVSVISSLRHPTDEQTDRKVALTALGKLWLAGVSIDWDRVHDGERRRRIPLPTYAFERQRYWVERDETFTQALEIASGRSRQRQELERWFYQPSWRRFMPAELRANPVLPGGPASWIVFMDPFGLGERIARMLRDAGERVTTVARSGQDGRTEGARLVDPRNPDDYQALVRQLAEAGAAPTHVIHLWGVTESDHAADAESLETSQDLGFFSLLHLAQAIGREDLKQAIRIVVVTNHMREVTGGELTQPEKATVTGPCRVIPQEFRNVSCVSVDIETPSDVSAERDVVARRLLVEALLDPADGTVAYRGRHRWVGALEPTPMGPATDRPLRNGGTYLITGGQGGIGLVLAEYLAREFHAALVLTGRTPLPASTEWTAWLDTHGEDEAVSGRIRAMRRLEECGGRVLAVAADTADLAAMRNVVQLTHEAFGPIHGVIHAAGVAGGGIVQMKQRDVALRVLEPKVKGTLVLADALKNEPLDFIVLCSSTAALLGGFGQVDYCGANAFLDAYAHRPVDVSARRTIAINWDVWKDVGMAVNTTVSGIMKTAREQSLRLGMSPAEGVEAFTRVLGHGAPQVAVFPLDLTPALVRIRRPKRDAHGDLEAETLSTEAGASPVPRDGAPAAAVDDVERAVRETWHEVLGRKPEANDNFFELGGDSMTAIQVTARLKGRLGRDVPLVTLYEAPTVALLVQALDAGKRPAPVEALQGVERRAETRLEAMQRRRRQRTEPVLEGAP